MKNEKLSGHKLIVFVGAGASAGLGMPTTFQFIELLKQHWGQSDFKTILDAYNKFSNSKNAGGLNRSQPIVDSEYLRDWFLELRRSAESIQVLPQIKSNVVMTKATRPQTAVLFIDSILADFDSFTRSVYQDVIPEKAYQHYVPLLKGLSSKNINAIPIFTTNYDLVFESMQDCTKCSWNIETGMKKTGRRVVLDTKLYDQVGSNPKILLYKLHGSTDWWMNKESGEIQQIPLDHKAPENCRDLLIYPTREKFEQMKEKPFSFYYDRLKTDLSSEAIRMCIAIGYSFRDKFINNMFLEALKKGLRLVVFDKSIKQRQLLNEFETGEVANSNVSGNIHIHNIDFGNWQRESSKFSQILNEEISMTLPNP
ncbi:MAG: SIR2 family protein [Chloroflexota bacterium]